MKILNLLLSALFVVLSCFATTFAQNTRDTLAHEDTVLLLQNRKDALHLSSLKIKELPFRAISDFGLLSPSAYYLKGGRMFYYGIQALGNNTRLDGMLVDDMAGFPVRALESYNLYTEQAPIDKGFALGGITTVETTHHIDSLTFTGEISSDYTYNMQAVNGTFFLGIPFNFSKKGKKSSRKPFLMITGNYRWTNNTDPIWQQPQRLNSAVLDSLADNPLRPYPAYGWGTQPNAAFVSSNDFTNQHVPDNATKQGVYPYIKLFLPISKNASLTIGNYSVIDREDIKDFDNVLFNYSNNGLQTRRNFDSYLHWNQNFTVNESLNISYDFSLQYANHFTKRADKRLDNRFFDYSYNGIFTTYKMPIFEQGSITVDSTTYYNVMELLTWDNDTLVRWEPVGVNPLMEAYNQNLFDFYGNEFESKDFITLAGGLYNGVSPGSIYGLWKPLGLSYSNYEKSGKEKIRVLFHTNITYKKHHFLIGGEYNRETRSHYTLLPSYLWNMMQSYINFHILALDKDNPILIEHNGVVDTVMYNRKYDEIHQGDFDKNLRKALGLPVDGLDYILIDSYDQNNNTISYYDKSGTMHTINTPDNLLNLNLFTAGELFNGGNSIVSYAGYDYLGNKVKNSSDPYAFFDDYSMNAEKPEYWAAYAQDEFNWKNLHVRLGLRLDVFDAHHPVLKDDYSLMDINTVEEAQLEGKVDFFKPDNIGDDYKVYVNSVYNPQDVTGFRHGDNWFDAIGREISDPSLLDAGQGISPYLKYPNVRGLSDENWTPGMTFKDYPRAVNLLPQIALDYLIAKKTNLYVHYASFTRNPVAYSDFRPDIYNYFIDDSQIIPNPALKPIRSGKLFVGIKSLLWKNLTGDLSFFQTTLDNYIYPKVMLAAYPHTYVTVINATNRISTNGFQASLQWVNNLPSGLSGGVNFVKNYPHKEDMNYYFVSDLVLNLHAKYRFSNKNRSLKGFSTAVYYQYRHGTPYHYTNINHVDVTTRTPAFQFVNLNIQRDFVLSGRGTLTAYLLIENLFSSKNVFQVYSETGNATDDGFLADPANQDYINNQYSPESFRFLYQQHLYNPNFYDSPRIVRFGIILKY